VRVGAGQVGFRHQPGDLGSGVGRQTDPLEGRRDEARQLRRRGPADGFFGA
jgi:hypothetical protein